MAFFGGKKVASLFVAFSTIFSASFGTKAIANDTTKKNNTSISNPKKKKVEPKSDSEPLLGPLFAAVVSTTVLYFLCDRYIKSVSPTPRNEEIDTFLKGLGPLGRDGLRRLDSDDDDVIIESIKNLNVEKISKQLIYEMSLMYDINDIRAFFVSIDKKFANLYPDKALSSIANQLLSINNVLYKDFVKKLAQNGIFSKLEDPNLQDFIRTVFQEGKGTDSTTNKRINYSLQEIHTIMACIYGSVEEYEKSDETISHTIRFAANIASKSFNDENLVKDIVDGENKPISKKNYIKFFQEFRKMDKNYISGITHNTQDETTAQKDKREKFIRSTMAKQKFHKKINSIPRNQTRLLKPPYKNADESSEDSD